MLLVRTATDAEGAFDGVHTGNTTKAQAALR